MKSFSSGGALQILENDGDNWTIPKGDNNGKSSSSSNKNKGKVGASDTTPQRHERRKSNGFDGYDSWEEETPIITSSSRFQQKSLEEFHLIERGASQDNSRVAESVKVHSSSRRKKMGVVQWE